MSAIKTKKSAGIVLPAREVRKFIRDLNLLVVSFDRLGSTDYDNPKRLTAETNKFLAEVSAFKLLARMRGVLTQAYERQLGKEAMIRLEDRLEKIPAWTKKSVRKR